MGVLSSATFRGCNPEPYESAVRPDHQRERTPDQWRNGVKHKTERIAISVLIGLLFVAVTCGGAWAQAVSTAQVSGTVKDQTGAVLPGVEVILTQTGTGLSRTALTDETGSYTMPNLPIGPYRFEAALPGFRTYVQTGIVLQVNSNPVINATLEVGQVSEQIEVQANAALVETRSSGVGQVIDNQRVLELPLNGRQATELIFLAGMATLVTNTTLNPGTRNYPSVIVVIAGGMTNGTTYLLDGGTHNDPWNNLSAPLPFPDALQEFKVETSALPAQYGHHSAAAINAVTKSGTNDFHGDLFEFLRNGALNARNAYALTRDSLKRNQFGGTAGGPIIKNKLFFFAGYQDTVQRSAPATVITFVPTPTMMAGDFRDITSPACNNGRQINLAAPFAGNQISPSAFSTPAVNLAKRLPPTNDPCGRLQFGRVSNTNERATLARVDYQWSQEHSLFGRYTRNDRTAPTDYDGKNPLTLSVAATNQHVHSFVLGDTYLLGAGTVSSFRGTLLYLKVPKWPPEYFSAADLGARNVYAGVPGVTRITITGGFPIGSADAVPTVYNSTVGQVSEDLSLIRSSHQIGFGGNYIHTLHNALSGINATGAFTFTGQTTGLGLADFMTGKTATYSQGMLTSDHPRSNYLGMYLQDTWKANSRLTVNAGLRWEPYLPEYEKQGRTVHFERSVFDQGLRSTVYKNAPAGLQFPGDPGVPGKSYSYSQWGNFAPRLGFGWDPTGNGKMTIRAAYGIFYDFPNFQTYGGQRQAAPWGQVLSVTNVDFADPWQTYPGGNPFPAYLSPNVVFPTTAAYPSWGKHINAPYVEQWNLNIQRQIGTDWLLSANYLGSSTVHLWTARESNPAIYMPGASCVINGRTFSPCSSTANVNQRRILYLQNPDQGQYYGAMHVMDDGGRASYNGLFLSVQRRAAKGLTVQGNYTLSHCIGDPLNIQLGVGATSSPGGRDRTFERGNCSGDRRHLVNVSTVVATPQFSNGALRALFSGWQLSGIFRAQSGEFLTVTTGMDNYLSTQGSQRPNQVLADVFAPVRNSSQWLNPAAFAQPATGTYGNLGPNNILGPGFIRIDMGLTRTFRVRESQSIQFRVEGLNVPNHVNPGTPTTALNTNTFGRILTGDDPRIMQLALKYVF